MNLKSLLRLFAPAIEAVVSAWLQTRALVIPEAQKAQFAKKYGLDPNKVQEFALEVGQVAIDKLDSLFK